MAGPAAALAGALEKLAVPKTANALLGFATDMKDVAEKGNLAETFKSLSEFGVSIEPLMAPLQVVTSQINTGTIENVIKLMNSMFTLMDQPAVQRLLQLFIDLLNGIINNVDRGVNFIDKALSFFSKLAENDTAFGKFVGYIEKILVYIIDFATYGDRAQIFFQVLGNFLTEKLGPMIEPTKELLTQVGNFIHNTWDNFMDKLQNNFIPWWNTNVDPVLDRFMLGLQALVSFWAEQLEPIIAWFLEQLGKLEEAFQNLTGIDIGKWFSDFVNTVKGWFS